MSRLDAFRRLDSRRRLAVVGVGGLALAVAGVIAGYLLLVLTTLNQPPPVGLASVSPVASYDVSDPSGEWLLDAEGGGFAGYRAREILAFEWIRSPNEAVARTTAVAGRLTMADGRLVTASVTANVLDLRSDTEMRDGHVVEYLGLRTNTDATFVLTEPIDVSGAGAGEVRHVAAVGELTILGIAKTVTFPLDVRWSGDRIDVSGALDISRADYHMDVSQLLAFRVADTITLELQLVFRRPCVACETAGSPQPRPTIPSPTFEIPSEAPTFPPLDVGQLFVVAGGGSEPTITSLNETDLYLIDPATGVVTNLTLTGSASEFTPALSPDGRTIAYARGEAELWLLDLGGAESRRLSEPGIHLLEPDWSPDGTTIVAVRNPDEAAAALVLVDPLNGAVRELLDLPGVEAAPRFAPDGRTIAFSFFRDGLDSQQIWLVDADGANARPLTSGSSFDYSPDWSPDGGQLAFLRDGHIALIAANGGDARTLVDDRVADHPAWSPDGAYIAFVEYWRDELQLVRLADGEIWAVPELFEVVSNPVWLRSPG